MNYYEFSKFQPISKQTGPKGTIHMSLRFTEKPLTNLEFEAEVPGRDFEEQRTPEKLDFRSDDAHRRRRRGAGASKDLCTPVCGRIVAGDGR